MKRERLFIFLVSVLAPIAILVGYFTLSAETVWRLTRNAPLTVLRAPYDAELRFEIGNHYFGGGTYDLERAKKYYDEAYRTDPTLAGLNYQLARVYFIQGNFYTAREHINKELELYPESKRSYYVRGLINGYSENYSEAEKDFKEFLDWKPESWAGYNDLAWIYFRQGEFAKVALTAKKGLEWNPKNAWLLTAYGTALLNLGQEDEARRILTQALMTAERLTPEEWGKAYPGNNPESYEKGLQAMIAAIRANLELANR